MPDEGGRKALWEVSTADGSADPLVGLVVKNRRLLRKIGEGTFGAVYVAQHVELMRVDAVKILKGQHSPQARARFFAEAKVAASLQHKNVVQVFDFDQSDPPCIVMELLRGCSLDDLLRREKTLDIARALHMTRQVVNALAVAHDRGVVHRDLKPENVFVEAPGTPDELFKILDFGIAKLADAGAHGIVKTAPGTLVGTAPYMSPEQVEGGDIDGRSDLYALGCILYECIVGARAFPGENHLAVALSHLTETPSLAPLTARSAPSDVVSLIARLLEREPGSRFQDARSTQREVDQCLDRLASTRGNLPADMRQPRRLALAGVTLALAAGVGMWRWFPRATTIRNTSERVNAATSQRRLDGSLEVDAGQQLGPIAKILQNNPLVPSDVNGSHFAAQEHQTTIREYGWYLTTVPLAEARDVAPLRVGEGRPDDPQAWLSQVQASRYCVALGARLMTSEEWARLRAERERVGPLWEWTATLNEGGDLALIRDPADRDIIPRSPVYKATGARSADRGETSAATDLGFRCAR